MVTGHWEMVAASAMAMVAMDSSAEKKDADELSGKWAVVSTDADGKAVLQDKGQTMTFTDGRVYQKKDSENGKEIMAFLYRINSSKEPKELDFISKQGDATLTMHGIYKVEKDQLTICFGILTPDGTEPISKRPTDCAPGLAKLILVLHREKKGDEAREKADGGRDPQ